MFISKLLGIMKSLCYLLVWLVPLSVFAQPAAKALERDSQNLPDRYAVLKSNSQTYEDYKVIKEYILDGFWKLTMDSLHERKEEFAVANAKIDSLQAALINAKAELVTHQASVEELVYDSKHIAVAGVPVGKNLFLIIVAIAIAGLVVLVTTLLGRMKLINSEMKEKSLVTHSLTLEFEDYKRKALDRQTKLSRELQNERNKLMEMRGQRSL